VRLLSGRNRPHEHDKKNQKREQRGMSSTRGAPIKGGRSSGGSCGQGVTLPREGGRGGRDPGELMYKKKQEVTQGDSLRRETGHTHKHTTRTNPHNTRHGKNNTTNNHTSQGETGHTNTTRRTKRGSRGA